MNGEELIHPYLRIHNQLSTDQLYDTDKVNYNRNLLNFTNANFFNYGLQTDLNPYTDSELIQSNYNYTKNNARLFAEQLVLSGIPSAISASNPLKEVGRGAESVVYSKPLSTRVIKKSSIPRTEMYNRNRVPGALKTKYISKDKRGIVTYSQPKVKPDNSTKAKNAIDKLMLKSGWKRVSNGTYTNGKYVVSDLDNNIGKNIFRRFKLMDFSLETPEQYALTAY